MVLADCPCWTEPLTCHRRTPLQCRHPIPSRPLEQVTCHPSTTPLEEGPLQLHDELQQLHFTFSLVVGNMQDPSGSSKTGHKIRLCFSNTVVPICTTVSRAFNARLSKLGLLKNIRISYTSTCGARAKVAITLYFSGLCISRMVLKTLTLT